MEKEIIKSDKGFFVGDICYALSEKNKSIWAEHNYEDGVFAVPGTSLKFAVKNVGGDYYFEDTKNRVYETDAGNIGVVPLELLEGKYRDNGHIFKGAGEAIILTENKFLIITLPNGEEVRINYSL